MVFAALVFHDRIRQAEVKVTEISQASQAYSNQIQGLTQKLERTSARIETLETQLSQAQDNVAARDAQIQSFGEQIQTLAQSIPTDTSQADDLTLTALWTVATMALILAGLEFILQ